MQDGLLLNLLREVQVELQFLTLSLVPAVAVAVKVNLPDNEVV
jgi:hypothetical protein